MRTKRNLLLGVTTLLVSSTMAFAQDGMPEQTTEDPVVAADTANHVALLEPGEGAGEATGAAWIFLDPQNNTVNWTVEFTGFEPISAEIVCGDGDEASINLAEDEMDSPIEGQLADIDQTVFEAMDNGECAVVLAAAEDGGELRGDIVNADMTEGGGM